MLLKYQRHGFWRSYFYYQNIKLIIDVNLSKLLDTELIREKGYISAQVFNKLNKFPLHWSSKFPVRYRLNVNASNFDKEIWRTREKYWNAGFPSGFANETIHNFKKETDEIITLNWLFEKRKIFIVRLPNSSANEKFSKSFANKIEDYTKVKLN